MGFTKSEILHDVPPYIRTYKDGTIERLVGEDVAPASFDSETGTLSKDLIIIPETGVLARFYRPNLAADGQKLPLVVYFHGGAFCISSVSDPVYHNWINKLVSEANVVVLSVNYRRVPEHPLPAAYEDSWAALQWVASHAAGDGTEAWISDGVDFDRVFLAGDSAGSSISHHMATRIGLDLKILGIIMIQPYFWGKEPIGSEVTDAERKGLVDKWWEFVCPSDKGNDDPLINPFADGAPKLEDLACERVLVCVAEKDILRDRGKFYYESLGKSGWKGKLEMLEIEGEDHVFHLFNPNGEKAIKMNKRVADFIHQE